MAHILSGIQPSGGLHIGNYIGALKQWVELQEGNDALYCIVDLHAITVYQDPKTLREKNLEAAALFLAAGVDPKKAHIFIQSENPDHPYLAWVLNCITPYGQLERMTQFKDKSAKQQENTTAGLFDYPVLMAADILLYDTDEVPVGDDQKQHIELTRDLAEKFNRVYGEVFKLPKPRILKETARIMSLQNPTSKMSKSDSDLRGAVFLLDDKDTIVAKVKSAVTDSGSEITQSSDKPAISNLLSIYSAVSGNSVESLEGMYKGKGYGDFKNDLAHALVTFLEPLQKQYNELLQDRGQLEKILDEGRDYARSKSSSVVAKVNQAVGLGR